MGKEAKIGLGIVAILVIVLGVVVFRRVWGEKDLPDVSVEKPTVKSAAGDDGTSTANGTILTPAASDSQGSLFGGGGGSHQWIGARDRIEDGRESNALGQPRTALMPRTDLPIESRTSNLKETEFQGPDRFGRPASRDFRDNDFGTGRTNVLRPNTNDGALDQSSRRPNVEGNLQQNDPGLGRLRPTSQVRLQPGPEAIQAGATTQAQYSTTYRTQNSTDYGNSQAQTQYGTAATAQQSTPGAASLTTKALGGTSSAGRYGTGTYGTGSYRALDTLRTANQNYGGAIAADGGVAQNGGSYNSDSYNSGSYTVKPNDSFWLVSKKVYGRGDFYKALIEHNRKKFPDPSKIRVGDVIATPDVAQLRKNYPVFCPKKRNSTNNVYRTTALNMAENRGQRVYVVQHGDTVFNIARDELGKSARWAEICQLNRDLMGDDYDHLNPGWQLLLPGGSPATNPVVGGEQQDSLTRQIWKQIK